MGVNALATDFMPMGLETLASSAYKKTNSGSNTKVDDDFQEWLDQEGIEVNQPGEDLGLDFTDYLQLMVAQLQNQTMDNAMDSTAMLEQLVQMSTVQTMASLQTSMQTVADATALNYAASLVGKTVTVGKLNDDNEIEEIVGTVTGTGTYQGMQVIFVDGEMYPLSNLMAVGTLPEIPEEPGEGGEGGDGDGTGTGDGDGTGTGGGDTTTEGV